MMLGILRVIGIIVFLYLLWRDLRESYDDQKIIKYSWLALIGFMVAGRLMYGLINWGVWNDQLVDWVSIWNKPGMSYTGAYLGLVLVTWAYARKEQWKFLSFMEDLLKPLVVFSSLLIIDECLRSKFDLKLVVYLILLILIYIANNWLSKKYRSFVWYKSGKKGFVLLSTNFLFFLAITITLIFFKENIFTIVLASIISLISVIGLFILGEVKYERK